MGWGELRGHQDQMEMFRRAEKRGRLGQVYLLAGPEGIGKKRFARLLARALFCQAQPGGELDSCGVCAACKQIAAGTHPDLFQIELRKGKQELTIDQFLGPPERRGREGLCHDLSLKPMSADRKIAIIDDADLLNEASANALLKTLEEPEHSLILLIAANPDGLLPTIRSRCQTVRFSALSDSDLAELLVETGAVEDPDEAVQLAPLCDGGLPAAGRLGDDDWRARREAVFDALAADRFNSAETATLFVEAVEEAGSDAASQRQQASWLIRHSVDFYRRALRALARRETAVVPQVASFADRFDADLPECLDTVGALLERTVLAQIQLDRRLTVSLCLEALCDDLGRTLRSANV